MKKIVICLVLMLFFVGLSNAQTKTMIGTVVRYEGGNRWGGIVVKVGKKEYFIQTFSVAAPADPKQEVAPTPKIIGNVEEAGKTVRIYYTRIKGNEVRATKIVEVKKSKSRKR